MAIVLVESNAVRSEQDQQEDDQPVVRFGIEVNYVEVTAVVADPNGQFIRDLRREDFNLYEDGELQDIANFTLVDVPLEPSRPVIFAERVEPDVTSNTQVSEGRVYVIVLDDLHTEARRGPHVQRAAREFILERMGANDIAAVVHTGGRRDAAQEFTSSKRLLLAAVEQFHGRKLRSATLEKLEQSVNMMSDADNQLIETELRDPLELERTQRARNMLETLEGLSEGLADVHGRRKAIIYIGEGVDYNIYDVFQRSEATTILESTEQMIAKATRANVAVYSIDPRGLAVSSETSAAIGGVPIEFADQLGRPSIESALRDEFIFSQDSMRVMSTETGGFALLNQNDYSSGLERIVEENSHYYILGYYPTNSERDGKSRKIEVRVKRPDLKVTARKGYVAPGKRDKKKEIADVDLPEGASAELNRLVQSPLPLPQIPMRASATAFRVAKDKAVVPIVVEMDISGFRFEDKDGVRRDTVEFSVVAMNYEGKIKNGVRRDFQLALRPTTYQLMSQAGLRVMTALEIPSGKYQLRIVASELGGGQGASLFYDLEVPRYDKEELVMAPLVVTSAIENRVPVIGADEDKQKAVLLPATRRLFTRSDQLWVLSEIYPQMRRGESPPRIEVTTTLRASDEQAVFNNTQERGKELTGPGEGIIHKVEIPLSGLAPGDYLLEVKARNFAGGEEVVRKVLIEVF